LSLAVDHDFKSVNENLGHLGGDRVLVQVAQCLRSAIRAHDVLVRWGGDELVLLLPDTDAARATTVLARLVKEVSNLARLNTPEGTPADYEPSVSVGLTATVAEDTPESLLARADQALRRAKGLGAGQLVVL
jgi:diguanylate cyclase (GGDEF)-like protein